MLQAGEHNRGTEARAHELKANCIRHRKHWLIIKLFSRYCARRLLLRENKICLEYFRDKIRYVVSEARSLNSITNKETEWRLSHVHSLLDELCARLSSLMMSPVSRISSATQKFAFSLSLN